MDRFKNWLVQNSANLITVFGLITTFWFLVIIITNPERLWFVWLLGGIVALTDFLDGKIARSLKIKSTLGEAMDHLRDKIFVCFTLIVLVWHYWPLNRGYVILPTLTEALVISLVSIEFVIVLAWFLFFSKKLDFSTNEYGRKKMFTQFMVILIWLTSLTIEKYAQIPVFRFLIYLIDFGLALAVYYALKSLEEKKAQISF